jgi:hypothetical protein
LCYSNSGAGNHQQLFGSGNPQVRGAAESIQSKKPMEEGWKRRPNHQQISR